MTNGVRRSDTPIGQIVDSGGALPSASLRLGPLARGAVLVLRGTGALKQVDTDVMRGLGGRGYESLAASHPAHSTEAATTTYVTEHLTRLTEDGWDAEGIAIIGFNGGGQPALHASTVFDIAAAVSLSPMPAPAHRNPIRTPWLGLLAGRDASALERLLQPVRTASGVYTEVVVYPDAPPEFGWGSGSTPERAARFDAWQRTLEWLDKRVMPRKREATDVPVRLR